MRDMARGRWVVCSTRPLKRVKLTLTILSLSDGAPRRPGGATFCSDQSMADNPLQTPSEFNPYQPTDHASQDAITHFPGLLETIAKLAFWQRVAASGLLFIAAVMTAYTVLILVVSGGVFDMGDLVGIFIYFAFFMIAVILPMVFVWRASRASYHYARTGAIPEQTQFVLAQLRFWRSTTITVLIFVGLIFLFMLLAMFSWN